MKQTNFRVSIVAYCLMPNHFHFVLRQNLPQGAQEFVVNLSNSFTRAFNTANDRKGPLFLTQFHAVPIRSVEQLLTVTRYVHRNPIASKIVSSLKQLRAYPWSSYQDYLKKGKIFLTETEPIFQYFNNDPALLQEFVEEDLDHSQVLQYIRDTVIRNLGGYENANLTKKSDGV